MDSEQDIEIVTFLIIMRKQSEKKPKHKRVYKSSILDETHL